VIFGGTITRRFLDAAGGEKQGSRPKLWSSFRKIVAGAGSLEQWMTGSGSFVAATSQRNTLQFRQLPKD
jgi:hypothetical protein